MNRDSIASLVVGLLCVSAVGIGAVALEDSLSTDPDDVINPDWNKLPLSQDQAADIESEMGGNEGDEQESSKQKEGGEDEQQSDQNDPGDEESEGADRETKTAQAGEAGDDPEQQPDQSGGASNDPEGTIPFSPPSYDWLLALLAALVLAAVAWRYRDRIRAFLPTRARDEDARDLAAGWPPEDPADEVERAWTEMVRRVDLETPRARTPRECALAASESDLDPDAVDKLTAIFEEVRYGDEPVTDDRRERVRRELGRLDGERGGETR